jgi:predicted amidohydrolase
MSKISIAGLQLALPSGDNRERIAAEVDATLRRFPWVQMVLLAELCTYGPDTRHADEPFGAAEAFYVDLARRHGIWLVPGSLYERRGEQVFNTSPVIDPQGRIVARYRKIYPFRPYEKGVASGSEIVVFDVPGVGRFGVSICYDGWFPEVSRAMAWQGAEVILHPTMTGTTDREQELIIAQANAIMNQCYFVDINNAGQLGNGRSIVVGPDGDVLHQAGELNEVIPLTLDLGRVRCARANGLKGLGQVLKSFRDTPMHYACYNGAEASSPYLDALGPLQLPRASDAGT